MPQAIDGGAPEAHHFAMEHMRFQPDVTRPGIVGSFGSLEEVRDSKLERVRESCEIAEIRLDILLAGHGSVDRSCWAHLAGFPLLFTARRAEEGGAGNLDPMTRAKLLLEILDDASLIDIEVASIREMSFLLDEIRNRGIPWVASFHDFKELPADPVLREAEIRASDAGAAVFKAAAMLESPNDLARLADFQLAPHRIPVSTMGMGPLAPVSRLLCAQAGSVLNYGYLGNTATAPGQWDSALLKQAVSRLAPINA